MAEKHLVTLRSADSSCTYSFDSSAQSALWVGLTRHTGADNAVARLESVDGVLTLRAVGESDAGGSKIAIEIPRDQEFVTSIPRAGTDAVSVYIRPSVPGMGRYRKLGFGGDLEFIIGRDPSSGLVYQNRFVSFQHARITLSQGRFSVTDLESGNGTFLNGVRLPILQPRLLRAGDVVQVLDLIIAFGEGFVSLNCPPRLRISIPQAGLVSHETIRDAWPEVVHREGDPETFYPAPRLSKSIHPIKLQVDDPPAKKEPDDQPVLMHIGPSFLMGMTSVFMVANSVSQIAGGGSVLSAMPSIAMAVAMIGGSVVWPIISRSYNRKKDEREEARRGRMYVSYLDSVETRLLNEALSQTRTLQENRRPVEELLERADTLSPLLMSHANVHEDFMDLRVGVGDTSISADIAWPQRHFSLSDDRMLDRVTELSKNPPRLKDVPLAFNPVKHFIAGILGDRDEVWSFLRGLLVQVCSLYSYQEVKVVVIGDESEMAEWGFLTSMGHHYDDAGQHRFVALSYSGMVEESLHLERELASRAEERAEVVGDYGAYYLIICANHLLAERSEAIKRLSKLRANKGFSLIYLGESLRDLPRECGYIIDLAHDGGTNLGITLELSEYGDDKGVRRARMFERSDVSGTLSQFDPDIMVTRERANAFAGALARVHLDIPEQRQAMPDSVGFLEMFEVANVSHLNIGQRWVENDASQTLQTRVGIDERGEPAYLNLHESIHGPHGLIAGTTGSGKSEFIITYILSLCANYSPDEVAFVLIDYKGGGLAGAFENERRHLPHLAGTITNLDGASINRSLVSIKSELKRRQDMFNKARDFTGESTMDIYKYLSFYRQGVLTEALPHLFIVADEFAELKQQESEFMDELISAARIGRSLGVHLILATQKPSGVVDDQIWSNSRFKVCLKVADAADSREMIQREDAANITQPGRYYILVGYNESFTSGQAAYAGGAYIPAEVYEAKRDNAVELLDVEGTPIARMRPQGPRRTKEGSEIDAAIAQIEDAAKVSGKYARKLWLDPLPDAITLAELDNKYGALQGAGLTAVVGEADDPDNQRQYRYEIDLAKEGNVLLYGSQSSGVEELVQTTLFSLATTHAVEDLWVYGMDFGAGALGALVAFPHCGGVVMPGDDERFQNLMRMLGQSLKKRQKALAPYGGSIAAYNERSGDRMPRIVVGVANLATMMELYPECEDEFVYLTREGPRYGVHFVVSASAASAVRMRLSANFAVSVPTMLNDATDYLSILGSLQGVVPPQQARRGLFKAGKQILEFQGASICHADEDLSVAIERAAESARMCSEGAAPPIPQLPQYVHMEHMGHTAAPTQLPVGYAKYEIEPCFFDVGKTPYMLVLGNDNDSIGRYLRGLREALAAAGDVRYKVVDPQGLLGAGEGDTNVLTTLEETETFVQDLVAGVIETDIVVFTSIVQTISSLSAPVSQVLTTYLANEQGVGKTSFVCASEAWRVRNIYDNWYKVISAYGNGVWCGSGFVDQTTFHFTRSMPEFRLPAERSDAFLVMRGNVTWVRLLEATNEPKEDSWDI